MATDSQELILTFGYKCSETLRRAFYDFVIPCDRVKDEHKYVQQTLDPGFCNYEAALDVEKMTFAASDAIITVNWNGEVVNSQTENLFGYQREELLGKLIEVLVPKRFTANHRL